MIIFAYSIILIILSILIGKKRGLRSILSLVFNLLIIILALILINFGFNIYVIAFISYFIISSIIIFYLNGWNIKTKSAYLGVLTVTIINTIMILYLNNKLHLGAFSYEFVEEISAYSFNIHLSLKQISFVVLLFISTGTISDTAIAISSALYEIKENSKLTNLELFKSGMNVGKDIIGTTVNTLLFSFIASFLGYLLWHNYDSFIKIINYHGFATEVIELLLAIIGCLIIIPITSIIEIKLMKKK